jgi:hypothetical protein
MFQSIEIFPIIRLTLFPCVSADSVWLSLAPLTFVSVTIGKDHFTTTVWQKVYLVDETVVAGTVQVGYLGVFVLVTLDTY